MKDILRRWEEVSHPEVENRRRLPKMQKDRKAKTLVKTANKTMNEINESLRDEMDINIVKQLMQSAATVTTEMKGLNWRRRKTKRKQPAWKEKLRKDIAQKQSDLSVLTELAKDVNVNERK